MQVHIKQWQNSHPNDGGHLVVEEVEVLIVS